MHSFCAFSKHFEINKKMNLRNDLAKILIFMKRNSCTKFDLTRTLNVNFDNINAKVLQENVNCL